MGRLRREDVEALFRAYGSLAHRRAVAILGDPELARDLVQEVFVNILRAPEDFRGEASPVTWLYQAVTNLCLRRLRDRNRRAELLAVYGPKEEAASGGGAEEALTLASILRRVPEELREIAINYYVDEMSQEEIAERLCLARRTVGNRLESFRRAALEAAKELA